MDRTNVLYSLKNYFKDGNCVFLHFIDGSELLVDSEPEYDDFVMHIPLKIKCFDDMLNETYCVPYENILYIVKTTKENIKKLRDAVRY